MLKIYGIKTWSSVRKALSFFKEHNLEVEFIDTRKETPTSDSIKSWVDKVGIDLIFNSKGTKYRSLGLKELNLNTEDKIAWLIKEPMLLKRPIIETNTNILVGFKEEEYKKTFL